MLSKSLLSRMGTTQVRRSLVQCAVKFDNTIDNATVTIKSDKKQKSQDNGRDKKDSDDKQKYLMPSISGLLLGASIVTLSSDEDNTRSSSFLSRFIPTVNAAEPINDIGSDKYDNNDSGDKKPKSRREQFNFIADLVEETAPGLVYIEIKDGGVRDYYTGQPITVSNGSGFIVDSNGLILTNAHVVINKPRASIQVRLQDGRVFTGVVEDVDVKSDLATVRINCSNLPKMKLGTSKDTRPGEWVIALGSPLALSNTITTGVVSNIARPPNELGLRDKDIGEYIQTDATITFGNSGGPLINLDGEAIGINSMKVSPGISFAIPIDYAKEFLRRSAESQKKGVGHPSRRYVGITMLPLNRQIINELKKRNHVSVNITHGILIYR